MPVVGIPVKMLQERLHRPLDRDLLVRHLQHLGCDVEGYATLRRFRCERCENLMEITETENPPVLCDRCGADFRAEPALLSALGETDVVRMELLAVRPDMFDPGGLARTLRGYLAGLDEPAEAIPPPASYPLAPPVFRVTVDPGVRSEACPRPHIACAVVRGITLDDDRIKVIMKLQENLHWALGRDRKHASIGVYDLDTLPTRELVYESVAPDGLRFVPLGLDPADPAAALSPAEVLEQHPKGQAYARLLADFARYPLLRGDEGTVLSMPPIINSEPTRVRGSTTSFFIDVTGTDRRLVNRALNILVTSLGELDPGCALEQVTVVAPDGERVTPDLSPQPAAVDPARAARTIGIEVDPEGVERLLRRMGHGIAGRDEQGRIRVEVPAYRNDILHPIDLMEDVAIAYGYHKITPRLVPTFTVGGERPAEARAETVRRILCGLGYVEVMTLILSSAEQDYDALRRPRDERCVLIDNPISVEQTQIRTTLLAGLLDTLSINTNHELPQLIFEVGNVSLLDPEAETGAREHGRVAGAAIGPKVDYSEVRATAEALLRELGYTLEAEADPSPTFIPGRGARIIACRGEQRRAVGLMGELHPEVLAAFKLSQPTATFELDLDALLPGVTVAGDARRPGCGRS